MGTPAGDSSERPPNLAPDDTVNKQAQRFRCVQCGKLDVPRVIAGKAGWIAIALWAISSLVWAVGLLLTLRTVLFIGLALYLPALLYTLWYFYQREAACRHCGSRQLESGDGD